MDRQTLLRGILGAGLGLGLLLAAGGAPAAERLHLGMPTSPPYLVHMAPFVAQELGYFMDEALEVKISEFRGGTAAHQALVGAGSDLDMADVPGPLVLVGIAKGSKTKVFYSFAAKNEALLVTAPEIKTVRDIKGKRVAIEGVGGYSHIGFLSVAQPAGIGDNDVTYVRTPPPQRVPFLLGGKADVVVIHVEQLHQAQREKPVNELARLWRTQPHYLYAAFAAREDKLRARRDVFVKAVRAMIRANRFIYNDKNKGKVLDIAEKYTKAPRWALDKTYDVLVEEKVWAVNAGLPAKTIQWTNDFNHERGSYEKDKPTPDQLVDLSIAQEALKTLGVMGAPFDPEH